MYIAEHRLELFKSSKETLSEHIIDWLKKNSFQITSREIGSVIAKKGSSFGLTDRHTKRVLEVIIAESNSVTAVSIYFHVTNFFMITGTMFGPILREEINDLFSSLRKTSGKS